MDIKREPTKNTKKYLIIGAGVIGLVVVTVALGQLKPAAPTVEASAIWRDTVERGPMVIEVRGPGTLVPENPRFISAVTAGRVEKLHLLPGASVEAETIILTLSNPDVEIQTLNADRQLTDAQSQLVQLRTNLESNRLNQASLVANLRQETQDAKRRAEAGAELLKKNLIIPLDQQQAQDRADALVERLGLEEARLRLLTGTIAEQLEVQEAQVERLRSIARFQHGLRAAMVVRAGAKGVLQEVPLQVGQYALAGSVLARVVPTPQRLKAVIRVPEQQAVDLTIGQRATIDLRNVVAEGRVTRIDPASSGGTVSVDVAFNGELPAAARPDLSVDGVIEIARLDDVLFTGRPAYGSQDAAITLFRVAPGGNYAERVTVRLGRTSVNSVELKDGLNTGDVVILSDMSRWDGVDRVRIK